MGVRLLTQVRKRQQFAGDVRNIKQNILWYSFWEFDGFEETFVHRKEHFALGMIKPGHGTMLHLQTGWPGLIETC